MTSVSYTKWALALFFLPLDIAFVIPKMKTILGQVQFFHSLDFQMYNIVHLFILGSPYLEAPFICLELSCCKKLQKSPNPE